MQPPGEGDSVGLGPRTTSAGIEANPPFRPMRALRVFGEIDARELPGVLLLAGNGFLLLTAYYILKIIREPLILQGGGVAGVEGEELKTYATAAQALLLSGVVPLYSFLVNRVNRARLIRATIAFLIVSLLAFFVLGQLRVPIGVPYYLWLGVVSVVAIAQFWSFANDYYTRAEGERLFPLVAVGGGLGAIVGAVLARWLLVHVAVLPLMFFAVGFLFLYGLLFGFIERFGRAKRNWLGMPTTQLTQEGGFTLIRKSRYLLLIAFTVLIGTLVNTHGEFILAGAVNDRVAQLLPPPASAGLSEQAREVALEARRAEVGRLYASFYSAVNVVGLIIQLFVVSHLFKHLRVSRSLYIFPIIALLVYGTIAFVPIFSLIATAKVVENSTDYSLQNTVRHTLFLPTSRAIKYKAKAAIDSFFYRAGDLVAAGTIFAGVHLLGLSAAQFALVNVALVLAWLLAVAPLARGYRQLGEAVASPPGHAHPAPA